MSRREIAVLACRVLAVALFGYGWARICHVIVAVVFHGRELSYSGGTADGFGVFAFVAGAIVWFRAPTYGRRIFPNDDDDKPVTTFALAAQDVLAVAWCAVGIAIAATALVELLKIGANVVVFSATVEDETIAVDSLIARILPEAFCLSSGTFLILRSRGLAEAVRRLRSSGGETSIEATPEQSL